MRPGNRIDSTNIGLYLAKEPLPEGVTRRQVEKELEEIAEKVKRKVFWAECGPFPCPEHFR